MMCSICARVGGMLVRCVVCNRPKQPRGRSAPMEMAGSLCNPDCPGYYVAPTADELWPGEVYGKSFGHFEWHETDVDGD